MMERSCIEVTADEVNAIAKMLHAESIPPDVADHVLIAHMKYDVVNLVDVMVGEGKTRSEINPHLAEIARYIVDRIVPEEPKPDALTFEEKKRLVMNRIGVNPVHINTIWKQSGLSLAEVSACLCVLELEARVHQEVGKLFRMTTLEEKATKRQEETS